MDNGWLAPDGVYYPVDRHGHWMAADRLSKDFRFAFWGDPQAVLERKGWIKLSDDIWVYLPYCHNGMARYKMPTEAQLTFIHHWCQSKRVSYPPAYIKAALAYADKI